MAVIEEKRASWMKLATTFNCKTLKSIVYENLRKIKGKTKRKVNVFKSDDQYYTTHAEIGTNWG